MEICVTEPQSHEKHVFNTARRIEPGEARIAYLGEACAGDLSLRARIEALLRVHDEDRGFLEGPPTGVNTDTPVPRAEGPETFVGPYRLIAQLGEGRMGTVFRAEQTQPVRREVALKSTEPGMDSREVLARFEAERQVLAVLDHPNRPQAVEPGMTPPAYTVGSQPPYFVMELVPGVPITRYCDENHLTPKERLQLFIPVCQAIQHAHQKGIVHRDL